MLKKIILRRQENMKIKKRRKTVLQKPRKKKASPAAPEGTWPADMPLSPKDWPETPVETHGGVCGELEGMPGEPVRH